MNPIAALALAVALGFGSGWATNGWRLNGKISDIKAEVAVERANVSAKALEDLADASRIVKESAIAAQLNTTTVNTKLDLIRREYKNAKPPPLPDGCKPDAVRMHVLTDTAAAVDEAIARSVSGGAVPAERAAKRPDQF